ncbi:MAG: two-component system response regulator [Actinomycetaceae bacterium]|nr:two-component system response regulator [Actinomycetaceae bacterium]
MSATTAEKEVNILLYSDDSDTRKAVMDAVGIRPGKGMPRINWVEAATAEGAIMKFEENDISAIIADGETQKVGGMALLRRIEVEYESLPPSLILIARQQDEWLAKFAGTRAVLLTPLDPIQLADSVTALLKEAHV